MMKHKMQFFFLLIFLTVWSFRLGWTSKFKGRKFYLNQFAVEIIGATQEVNRIARSHGFINTGNVLQNYYSFISPSLRKRSLRRAAHLHNTLIKDPRVLNKELIFVSVLCMIEFNC